MKCLNLTKDYNPLNAKDSECINFESFLFPDGTPHFKLTNNPGIILTISLRVKSFNDLFLLLLAVDAIKRVNNTCHINLFLAYVPGSRQDRVMVEGEPLTIKVVANLINSCNFNQVTIVDPHSDVTPALINNCVVTNNHKFVEYSIFSILNQNYKYGVNIISPDAGSNKKVNNLVKYLIENTKNTIDTNDFSPYFNLVKCDKDRDISTGNITGFEVYADDLEGKDCIIIDDCCSNGGTFLGLANELKLKNAGNLYLVVTHFDGGTDISKTLHNLSTEFKNVYATDSLVDTDNFKQGFLKIIKLKDL